MALFCVPRTSSRGEGGGGGGCGLYTATDKLHLVKYPKSVNVSCSVFLGSADIHKAISLDCLVSNFNPFITLFLTTPTKTACLPCEAKRKN